MSLQVWLPLTKDLRQQGISNTVVTNSGATYSSTGGKLGGCYVFDGTDDAIGIGDLSTLVSTDFTFACWFYHDDTWSSKSWETILGGPSGFELEMKNSTTNSPCVYLYSWGKGNFTYDLNTWNHLVMTRNSTETKVYLNGELKLTGSAGTIPSGDYFVGAWKTSAQQNYKGKINDVRFYDNCLSAEEVKRISQGLIVHYPLNHAGFGPTNLLKNGFGELNQENWGNSNIYTDVPSDHPEIKKSYKDNESLEFIPLFRNSTYKFTGWVKAASSSGNSYPSLKPYDADKLFISTYHCREGFNLSTMTTLKQQLKPGDTKIYVDDLSAWNANSGHYYDVAAIFSYTDGQGYTWPDGMYTRNCPAFATGTTAKTNLDKTNNIITLLSAYTGPTMPVGTKLCASTYGSTYFYPWGGPTNSSIADWTYKEGTFSSENVRMECAKYIRVYAYSTCYQAGMTLTNLTADELNSNIEFDISGFCNNGTRAGDFTWLRDTPKYSVSQYFPNYTYSIHTPMGGIVPTAVSMNCWIKSSNKSPRGSYHEPLNISSTNYEFAIYYDGRFRTGYYLGSTRYVKDISGTNVLDGQWHMLTSTCDGTTFKSYVDAVLVDTTTVNGNFTSMNTLCIGDLNGGTTYGNTELYESDVRVYVTALSADDVLALYNKKI